MDINLFLRDFMSFYDCGLLYGAFWVKIFKFLYRFIEKYWYYIWIVLSVGVLIYEFMNFII